MSSSSMIIICSHFKIGSGIRFVLSYSIKRLDCYCHNNGKAATVK